MTEFDTQPLKYQIKEFLSGGKGRFIVVDSENLQPPFSLSVYENIISKKTNSSLGARAELQRICFFLTWAAENDYDFEKKFSNGEEIQLRELNSFTAWLGKRGTKRDGKVRKLKVSYYNNILNAVSNMFQEFVFLYSQDKGIELNLVDKKQRVDAVKYLFKQKTKKEKERREAPDLSEKEIKKIEKYLRPIDIEKASSNKLRDYIIWHLAIEFGFRIGEILALRVEDTPAGKDIKIKIVRIEDRGDDYFDPRGADAPRPKTLGRSLGFIYKNSPLKKCLNEYITRHRYRKVEKFGVIKREMVSEKSNSNFLLLSHKDDCGLPLSRSRADDIAEEISKATGIKFTWHLARHAFFNRAYGSIVDQPNYNALKTILINWGGWSNPESLQIYINRAKVKQCEKALCFYQENNTWDEVV